MSSPAASKLKRAIKCMTEVVGEIMKTMLEVGFNTGTGKPAVFPKRVRRVRVRFWLLANRDTPRTRTAVSRVCTGILQWGKPHFYSFLNCFSHVFFQ